jgi:thymidylate synthase
MELIAAELGIGMGEYTHIISSSHLYDSDSKYIERVISDYKKREHYQFTFPSMPKGTNMPYIEIVQKYEELLRTNQLNYKPINGELPEYWEQVVQLLEIKRQMTFNNKINSKTLNYLCPLFKYYIDNTFSKYY